VVEVATQEIGVHEEGGNNQGDRIGDYLATTGLDEGYAWCAAFVKFCFSEAGITTTGTAWSPDWFTDNNTKYIRGHRWGYTAKPADVGGLYYASLGRIGHVFLISKVTSDYFVTIEGNTTSAGTRESNRRDGVYKRYRPHWALYKISNHIDT